MAHGLSCPAACGILVPRTGIKPMPPALEGGFFTTGPPGKSLRPLLMLIFVFKKDDLLSPFYELWAQVRMIMFQSTL